MGEARWGPGLGSRYNGRIPGSLTIAFFAYPYESDYPLTSGLDMLFVSLRATRPSAQGTGGEFTAWLPASHRLAGL